MTRIRQFLMVAALVFASIPAAAAVTDVAVSPDPIAVNQRGSALVTLRWRIQVTTSVPVTLESPDGAVLGGPGAETPGRRLAKSVSTPGVTTHAFVDRIRISQSAIAALAAGSTVVYQRTWNDGGAGVTRNVALVLGSGGVLSIQGASMRFDDGSLYAVVDAGASLTAVLRLASAGSGRFDGIWQVSGPAGGGSSGFRPIGRTRTTLAGSRTTVFESPTLPTDRPGLYRVRLLPGTSAGADTADAFPILSYMVASVDGPNALGLIAPQAGATLSAATRFAWEEVTGASVYRLEFIRIDGPGRTQGVRVAAVDLPAGTASARLKPFTMDRIRRSNAGHWRVVALDGNGRVVAASQARSIEGGAAFGAER